MMSVYCRYHSTKVWSLASPLKRSEYLASGMVVCGIDHTGHQIEDSGDWLQLFTQREFITSTVDWIANLDRSKLQSLQKQSRDYAERESFLVSFCRCTRVNDTVVDFSPLVFDYLDIMVFYRIN